MFEISWSEILILAVVTLIFVGPKELPVFLRTIGRYAGMARRHASEFKAQFDAAMREAEFAQMKEEMDKMQASVNAEVMEVESSFKEAEQSSKFDPTTITTLTPRPKEVSVGGEPVVATPSAPAAEISPVAAEAASEAPPMPATPASFKPTAEA